MFRIVQKPQRTIPTWVGRTPRQAGTDDSFPDHPHVGGENLRWSPNSWQPTGPSPRGWGERSGASSPGKESRTIPTWVGRTNTVLSVIWLKPDHPHVGGENSGPSTCELATYGPSPRGWGERAGAEQSRSRQRTIPTWVGRTQEPSRGAWPSADHPHVGGENLKVDIETVRTSGPSPRGWGEPWEA